MGRRTNIPIKVIRPSEYRTTPSEPEPEKPAVHNESPQEQPQETAEYWRDQALRLRADMDNFRKRQQRLSQERIEVDRQQMLRAFLGVVDDLERALAEPTDDAEGLRQGIELTHRSVLQFLEREGVQKILAENQPFDPNWHEAIATVRHNTASEAVRCRDGLAPDIIVQVTEPGYRLGDELLRPAKVIVAV